MERHFLDIVRAEGIVSEKFLPKEADTVLLVEQLSDSRAENEAFIAGVRRLVMDEPGLAFGAVDACDPQEQENLWQVRKRAVQILQRLPGPRRVLPFVEDITVPPDKLVAFIRGLREVLKRSGAEAVVTSCGMCRTQLAHGTGLAVYHPMELAADALVRLPV